MVNDLSEKTDKLNAALRDAEQAIVSLQLGVSACVEFQCGGVKHFLSFGRYVENNVKTWRLLGGDEVEFKPLVNCTRNMRIEASFHLNALVNALYRQVTIDTERVEVATTAATTFAAIIREAR